MAEHHKMMADYFAYYFVVLTFTVTAIYIAFLYSKTVYTLSSSYNKTTPQKSLVQRFDMLKQSKESHIAATKQ